MAKHGRDFERKCAMTFKEAALKYYNGGYDMNCSESVLHGANDVLNLGLTDIDYKLLGAYGGGCGCGSMCGAVASVIAVIGAVNINTVAHQSDATKKAAKFIREIKKRYGSIDCKDLKLKFHTPERLCADTVEAVADVLDEIWSEIK